MKPERYSLTIKCNGIENRLVSRCSVYASWMPRDAKPQPPAQEFSALWDTGATNSMVTRRVVDALNLLPEGYTRVHHVGGLMAKAPQYFINLVALTALHFPNLLVVQGEFIGSDVIIGMDIINRGDFAVSNRDGATTFSFRIPSIERFDFVQDDNRHASASDHRKN